ncbi:unnamed protein product [Adineta ricciae]|uniref:Uncharacterized protein n=2 Tax=Adineta ricciae TaxID=249248 RepID=A0A814BKZ8_ADIRI|nr:unnamed protein product [Adineta ricciae]
MRLNNHFGRLSEEYVECLDQIRLHYHHSLDWNYLFAVSKIDGKSFLMSSLPMLLTDENILPTVANVTYSRVAMKPGGQKSAQLVYFNHEEDLCHAIQTVFQNKAFDLPSPKIIIVLKGGISNSSDRLNDFNEKLFSASVARLLLDIGRNKLSNDQGAPWLFSNVRHDSVAGRIIQITKQQYLANDIPLSRFVTIGYDVCPSVPLEDAPHDYQSLANAITNGFGDKAKTETSSCGYANYRVLNKRLSRVILYGRKQEDLVDRTTILQRCVEEIGRVRDSDKSECVSVPKIILLYGGDVENVEPIHRLLSAEIDRKKFGLVIIRGSGGLADVLTWVCDKIRSGGTCVHGSEMKVLTSTFLRELKVLVNQLLGSDLTEDLITLVTYLAVTRCKKIRVCDEDDDLSLYLLEALVTANQNQRLSSLKLHLSLAFDLNQPKFASRMLRSNPDMPEEDLIQLAKMAIIRDQVQFLHVLEDTCGITSDNLGEKFECELSVKMNYNHDLFLECIQQDFGCSLDNVYHSPDENIETAEDEIQSINVKLFLWAVFFDHYNLSLHFWRRLNDRLCGALIAAHVYRHTAELCVKRSSTEIVTVQKLRDHADEYENLAMRLLQCLYLSNPNMARLALKRENFEFNKLSSLEVAIMSHSEDFVGHTAVQEVFDFIWSGETTQKIKGKHFDRMLASTASSFGHATTGIQAKDQQNVIKHVLTMKNKLSRPRVKYQVHFLFYIIFLCLLSYLVLFVKPSLIELNEEIIFLSQNGTCAADDMFCARPKSSKCSWSLLQLIINIWVFMFALEEFRQAKLFKTKENSIVQTVLLYLDESWNKLDTLCVIMYVASIILESYNTKTTLNAARAFLAVDVVLWFIRLLILLMIDRTVGPMLLMIQAMLNDMMTFFSIFFVFTSAYGVASFSLLKSGQPPFDLAIFRKIFHAAYWHVFGQINDLDDVKDNFELTGWAAFVLLAFYMAISNILLVNLLVAMFSNTFDRMYSKMDTLWKFHRYHIIKEYTILAPLPPPLNLLSTGNYESKPFNPELSSDQILNLRRREALAYESDVFEQAAKDKQSEANWQEKVDSQLRQLRKTVSHVKITCEASTMAE